VGGFSFPGADRDAGARARGRGKSVGWAVLAATLACSGAPGAGSRLGDDLGTFHVTASQLTNDCGAGALGATASFAFDVELQRDYTQLFWGGQSGRMESGDGFDVAAIVRVPVGTPSAIATSCVIERDDHVSGSFESTADGGFEGFAATLSYSYASDPTTPCTLDLQSRAGLPELPCSMNYALRGQRTRAPADAPAADPNTSAPGTTAPGAIAPRTTAPGAIAPGTTAPKPPSSTPR
jgi:hypothetical protein